MAASRDRLLSVLPPFTNESVLIEPSQDVPDIIREVVNAHSYFGSDYDFIWQFFDRGSVRKVCESLFNFCKANIAYRVETDNEQTTKSPSAILALGYGDCKHYASFIGGVLDAINRNTGRNIDWAYRFASYDLLTNEPGHVFIVVSDRGEEIWVDPCLKNFDEGPVPSFVINKKVKAMPLYRISGMPGEVGFIDPATAAAAVKTAASVIGPLINSFGDKVPNYPIKSQNTLKAIQADLSSQMPMPPKSVDEAKRSLEFATQKEAEFAAKGGNVDTTKSIIYGEYADALEKFIAVATQSGATADGETPSQTPPSKKTNLLLIGGAVLVAGYFLLSPKRKVSGTNSLLLPLGIAAAAYFLFFNKKPDVTAVSGIGQDVDCCLY